MFPFKCFAWNIVFYEVLSFYMSTSTLDVHKTVFIIQWNINSKLWWFDKFLPCPYSICHLLIYLLSFQMILRPALFSVTVAILPFSCFVAFVVGMFLLGFFSCYLFSVFFFFIFLAVILLMHLLFFSHKIELHLPSLLFIPGCDQSRNHHQANQRTDSVCRPQRNRGPHHHRKGQCVSIEPKYQLSNDFYKRRGVWGGNMWYWFVGGNVKLCAGYVLL